MRDPRCRFTIRWVALGVMMIVALSAPAAGHREAPAYSVECPAASVDLNTAIADFDLHEGQRNYLIFNHAEGVIEWPVPAQLEARDGETFAILFACTAPDAFDYRIEAIAADQIQATNFPAGTESVVVDNLVNVASITWRHEENFPLYRVSVTARRPVQSQARTTVDRLLSSEAARADFADLDSQGRPSEEEIADFVEKYEESGVSRNLVEEALEEKRHELHSYTFPVWVRTVGWKLSFSSGFAFSELENPKFFLETVEAENGSMDDAMPMDGMGDPVPAEEVKIVRRDRDGEDDFRPDLMALANLQFPSDLGQRSRALGWLKHFGLSFGVGIGEDSEPRYYFGPSVNLGSHFVLTAGWAGGKVETLPSGQRLGEPAINGDSTLTNLPKTFETQGFIGIAFRLRAAEAEKGFLGALGGAQKVTDEELDDE
jgi:hypothetical protein